MFSSMYQPSPYYPLPAAYHPIQPLSPRDKYLAAVAEAEAARASYLADEAARREEEALQQRLAELRARRQRFSAPGSVDPRDRRLYELRREVEEEERRQRELALAAEAKRQEQERVRVRWEIEEQARREERRRQIVEGGGRSFGYPGFQSVHSRQSPFHPQSHTHHQPVARQSRPTVLEVVIGEPYEAPTADAQPSIEVAIQELLGQLTGLGNAQGREASHRPVQSSICGRPSACARPSALAKARAEAWKSAAAARGASPSTNKACPAVNKTCHSASQPCHPSSDHSCSSTNPVAPTAPQLDPTVIADLAGQFLGTKVDPTQVKSAMDMFSALVPQAQATQASASATQASASATQASAQPAQAPAQPRAAPSRGQAAEFGGLEGLLSTLFGGAQATSKPQPSSSSSAQASSSKVPTTAASSSAVGPSAQPAQSSSTATLSASPFDPLAPLRAQLATRLNTEEEAEIRDTMHAIMLSLQDQEEKFKAGSAGSSGSGSDVTSKANTNVKVDVEKTTANKPDITVDTAQAKGKGRASPEPPRTPTSQDIAASLDTVRNIDAAFAALAGDFAWPSGLDFTPVSSREASPARSSGDGTSEDDGASTTSSTTSPLSKLAYTARNQPVRFYEQSLSALLSQLDAVESWGSEEVRRVRREVVGRVGRALEEVEGEVEGRWGVWVRRETARGRTQVPATEEMVSVENDAAKVEADAVTFEAEVETEAKTNTDGEEPVDSESQAPSVAESVLTARPASPNPVTQASEEPAETVDAPIATNEDTSFTVDTAATPIDAPTVSDDAPAASDATPTYATIEGYEVEAADDTAEDASSPADLEHAAAPSDMPISDVDEPSSPSSMSSPSVDTFLLSAEPEETPAKKVAHAEGTDSDWSEVEA